MIVAKRGSQSVASRGMWARSVGGQPMMVQYLVVIASALLLAWCTIEGAALGKDRTG